MPGDCVSMTVPRRILDAITRGSSGAIAIRNTVVFFCPWCGARLPEVTTP